MRTLRETTEMLELALGQYAPQEGEVKLVIGISAERYEDAARRVEKELGIPVSSQDLMEASSIGELAQRLRRRQTHQQHRESRANV
jgi:hypothetical protein